MANTNFFKNFKPSEVQESRFGLIPEGKHVVSICSVMDMLASQQFKLDDNANISNITEKTVFDKAANQAILALVYKDNQGRVICEHRSTVGFIKVGDSDAPSPDYMAKNGIEIINSRYLDVKKGRYLISAPRTESCENMLSRLFNAAGATSLEELKDSTLEITVAKRDNKLEVVGWHAIAGEEPIGSPTVATNAGAADDDLPF